MVFLHRARLSGTSGDDSSRGGWIDVQSNYIKSEKHHYTLYSGIVLDLFLLLTHQPSSANPPYSNVPVPLRTALHSATLYRPFRRTSPFTAAPFTHSVALHHSFRLSSPLTSPPFTLALYCETLYTIFRRSSPFTLPPFTPALCCAALHSSFRRPSPFTSPPFTPAVFSAALDSRLSVRRPSPVIWPSFTAADHCVPLRPSFDRSLPFTPPSFTPPPPSLTRPSLRCPSLRHPSLLKCGSTNFLDCLTYDAREDLYIYSTLLKSCPTTSHPRHRETQEDASL
jgi:hypothetical protein